MNLEDLGKIPVSEDQPTGVDVRYEPEFEALQAEMDKLSIPSVAGEINWKKIGDMATTILNEKSKDLLVAGYFALSRLRTDNIQGLAQGVHVYRDLFETFWDDLYPAKKRMRGRLGAIQWWLEKTGTYLKTYKGEPISESNRKMLKKDLEVLEKRFAECFSEPPSLKSVQRFVETYDRTDDQSSADDKTPRKQQPSLSKTPPQPVRKVKPAPSSPSRSIHEESPVDEKGALSLAQNGLNTIRSAAGILVDRSPTLAMTYRLNRFATWCEIDSLPPATDGKMLIPPPDPQTKEMLQTLRSNENWPALLSESEKQLSQNTFWLDLNRLSAEAMMGMGRPYREAVEALSQETAAFHQRLSGIEKLRFNDDNPIADNDTIQWLQSISPQNSATAINSVVLVDSATGDLDQNTMAEVIQQANDLSKDNKLLDALALIQHEMDFSSAGKEEMLWRLALTQLIVTTKYADLAIPHFDKILEDFGKFQLENWDPDLALKGLKIIWSGLKSMSTKVGKQKAAEIFSRIAKLDPTEALRMQAR